jgi:hypothetical protein
VAQTQTSPAIPAQTDADKDGKAVLDTAKANRAALLSSYLSVCHNLRITPEAELKAELEAMTSYYCIDPADDAVVIEVASDPGTLGSYTEEQPPSLAGMTVEGLIHVTLTFQEGGKPSIGIQNPSKADLPTLVHNSEAAGSLYDGVIPW